MITHRGIWAIAHMLSRSVSKHSYISGAYPPPQTFVDSVSNKRCSWTHIASRVQQTHAPFLDQGANWFGAPATNVRRVSEANRILNRTNPPIVAKIKDYENCTHAKFAQFLNNWQRFFSDTRLRYKLSIIDPRLSRNGYSRELITLRAHALVFMTYEQLCICRLSNLPPPIVSIVLRKLAIVNTISRKQK